MAADRSTTQRRDPAGAYQFLVRIGNDEYGFSRISGLRRERENFTIQEGGLNDRVHILPGPVKRGGTVRLERGVYLGEQLPFYMAGEPLPGAMTIELCSPSGQSGQKNYTLVGLVVKSWEAGDLDASQNQILIDRFEIDYEFMYIEVK